MKPAKEWRGDSINEVKPYFFPAGQQELAAKIDRRSSEINVSCISVDLTNLFPENISSDLNSSSYKSNGSPDANMLNFLM